MKRILIVGGAGFIGINSARYFLKKGWKVTILDNLSRPGTKYNLKTLKKEDLGRFDFKKADIRTDTKILETMVNKHDVILHLAAQVAVTTSIANPREDFDINILGTFNILEAIRKSKNNPVMLYSSTNKVYGSLPQLPIIDQGKRYAFKDKGARTKGISEGVQLDFHSPYGCSKGAADQYVIDYSRIYGLRTAVFRQSCIYGEYQMGVEDQGWVAWFAIAALVGKKITIFGNGKQVRDLLYVGDLVRLYDLAIQNINKINGEAFNIGGGPGNTLSLIECLETLSKKFKMEIKTEKSKIRAGDQPIFVADIAKATRLLNWKPKVSIDEGLNRMISWIRENQKAIEKSR
jgi:CDP-paratose 2-epimerase